MSEIKTSQTYALGSFAFKTKLELLLNAPVSGLESNAITRPFAKKAKSNVVESPAFLPGTGISRAVSGLSSRRASVAMSMARNVVEPRAVRAPTPHTAALGEIAGSAPPAPWLAA